MIEDFPVCFGNFEPTYHECLCCEYAGSCADRSTWVMIPRKPPKDERDD